MGTDSSGSAPCSTIAHCMPVVNSDMASSINWIPSVAARFRVHQEWLSSNISKCLCSGRVESGVLWLLHEIIDSLWISLKHSQSANRDWVSFNLAFVFFQLGDLLIGQAIFCFKLNGFVAIPLIKWDRVCCITGIQGFKCRVWRVNLILLID